MISDELSQDFQSPFTDPFLDRAADLMGERSGKAKRAIPLASSTLMEGVLEKSKTPSQVKEVLEALERSSDEPSLTPVPNAHTLMSGEVILSRLFGGRASEVCEKFARETGLTSIQSREALGIAASALAPQLAAKARSYFPVPSTGAVAHDPSFLVPGVESMGKRIAQYAAVSIATVAILIFAFGYSNQKVQVSPAPGVSAPKLLTRTLEDPQTLGNLSQALAKGTAVALPQRFTFAALTFPSGSATLSGDAKTVLKQIARELRARPEGRIRLEGNADSLGNPMRNREIAQSRAVVVRNELVRLGVSRKQVVLLGRGESSPVDSNSTVIGRRHNRRVEIVLIGR